MPMPASISVVIPLYNKQQYIAHAIHSVLAQGDLLREVIIVDDGSTDQGARIVKQISDPRVRLICQDNGGVSKARNAGIAAATGEYIAFLDADDWYATGFLSVIGTLIDNFPSAGMYGTAYVSVKNETDLKNDCSPAFVLNRSEIISNFFAAWKNSRFFFTSSVCIRRSLFIDQSISFPCGESLGEDQDVWFRVAEKAQVAYCHLPFAAYRIDVADSLTFSRPVLNLLPVFSRLRERANSADYPQSLRSEAINLVTRQMINVSRNRLYQGDRRGALSALFQPECQSRPAYWWGSLAVCFVPLSWLLRARAKKMAKLGYCNFVGE